MAKRKKTTSDTEPSVQDLRNAKILTESIGGKTQIEIAKEFGLSRGHVNEILNSADSKKLAIEARSQIQRLLGQAVETLQDSMRNRHEDMRTAVQAATTILKGVGVLTDKIDIPQLKPFIVRFRDGREMHMGQKPIDEEEGE